VKIQWEVLEHKSYIVLIHFHQLLGRRKGAGTERTLKIRKLHNRYRSGFLTLGRSIGNVHVERRCVPQGSPLSSAAMICFNLS